MKFPEAGYTRIERGLLFDSGEPDNIQQCFFTSKKFKNINKRWMLQVCDGIQTQSDMLMAV